MKKEFNVYIVEIDGLIRLFTEPTNSLELLHRIAEEFTGNRNSFQSSSREFPIPNYLIGVHTKISMLKAGIFKLKADNIYLNNDYDIFIIRIFEHELFKHLKSWRNFREETRNKKMRNKKIRDKNK